MTDVLLVEDSQTDRRLLAGVLGMDAQLRVRTVTNGVEALLAMKNQRPDVVLTDLQMPEMDGLQLVAAIRDRYPIVPVILITSEGSEETAVKALEAGAASYVPKRSVADMLVRTVHGVLELATRRQSLNRVGQKIERWSCAADLNGEPEMFPAFAEYMCTSLEQIGVLNANQRLQVGVAIEQVLEDTFFHCNLEIDAGLRASDPAAYMRLLDQRSGDPAYRDRRIRISVTVSHQLLEVTVQHDGCGAALAEIARAQTVPQMTGVTGRGINLINSFMDSAVYDDKQKLLTISKRIAPN